MTFEVKMPPNIALILDVETDNRLRSLQHLRTAVKKHHGSSVSTRYLFTRLGRVAFASDEGGPALEDIMDAAIEAGAEDLEEDDDGHAVVWTPPNGTSAVIEALCARFELRVLSSELAWSPNPDTKVRIDDAEAAWALADLLDALRDLPEVQTVYSNVERGDVSAEDWARIEENLDVTTST